jgi:excisionase family DNA binding protein
MLRAGNEGDILPLRDVAKSPKATEHTIYRLAGARKIPAFKVDGAWRFSRADIDEWIKRHSSDQSDDPAGDPG